jgi:hypothetical protein
MGVCGFIPFPLSLIRAIPGGITSFNYYWFALDIQLICSLITALMVNGKGVIMGNN